MPRANPQTAHCPRCDKPFTEVRKRDAISKMMDHVKLAHPDYYKQLKEED